MRNDSKNCGLLKAGVVLVIVMFFAVPGLSSVNKLILENGLYSDFLITQSEFTELMNFNNIILLDVHEVDDNFSCCGEIEGSFVVTLNDLSCGSCIEGILCTYDYIVVYSGNSLLRTKAADLLRDDNYKVYELTEVSDLKTNPVIKTKAPVNDLFASVPLSNTTVEVGVYEREGRIKRLFGEAFSRGSSPVESVDLFIEDNAFLFGVSPEDLQFSHVQPIMYDQEMGNYKFTGVHFDQYCNDVPVFNGRLIFLVRNEVGFPLVLVSADVRDLKGFFFDLDVKHLNPLNSITSALNSAPNLINFAEPELVVWAGVDDITVDPALAYFFIADNDMPLNGSKPEKYLFVTDAETGDILYMENMILLVDVTGTVQGNATQGNVADFCEDVSPEALKWARVNIGGTITYTDANGNFILSNPGSSSVNVESRLRGQWFRVFNNMGADSVLSLMVDPPGPANFLHNQVNNNEQVRAEVNAYLHSNIVRDFILTYNPSYPGLTQNEFPVYVNRVDGYCPGNAWYDYSSINFCYSGGGYPNTAFSTIIHHEYGHHLVNMGGSGQGEYGEGMSDTIGMLITDDPGIGYGFLGNCNQPLRTGDNNMQYPCSG
ncbi:MAG: hypothetical protein QCI00_08290, partial [Candidatus Thermoplasmatota archaeon]|nr:hypothetical protein [Candidatus Thermoplasmatota archaeon]